MMNQELAVLLKMVLAHLCGDFVLQSKRMAELKSFRSHFLYLHILIVFSVTWIFTGLWKPSLVLALAHLLIDGFKSEINQTHQGKSLRFFVFDQCIHFMSIALVWLTLVSAHGFTPFSLWVVSIMNNLQFLVLGIGYLLVTTPSAFLIEKYMASREENYVNNKEKLPILKRRMSADGGKVIGILERCFVLTLVLLSQYEAIGFLIAGKSILRFASTNEELKSEVVLIGTLLSFLIAMFVGLSIKFILGSGII